MDLFDGYSFYNAVVCASYISLTYVNWVLIQVRLEINSVALS